MTCNDVQRQIVMTEQALPAAAVAHLDGCPACRAFAQVHGALLSAPAELVPRTELDRRVMDAVRVQLAARRNSVPQARRDGGAVGHGKDAGRRILPFPTVWWAAAAALVVVGLAVACLFLADRPGSGETAAARESVDLVAVTTEPDWRAMDLDTDMLALAVDLAMNGAATVMLASGVEDTAAGMRGETGAGVAGPRSIDDAILELELSLLLDAGLTSYTNQADGV